MPIALLESSRVSIDLRATGLLRGLAHNPTLTARPERISVDLGQGQSEGRVEVVFPVDEIEPATDVAGADRKKMIENLRGPEVLEGARFPTIVFDGRYRGTLEGGTLTGEIIVRGSPRPIAMTVSVTRDGADLVASGTWEGSLTHLGVKPFKALLGAIKLDDWIRLRLEAKFATDARRAASQIAARHLAPNPGLMAWAHREGTTRLHGKRAIVVGCGLGDDAEELASWGLDVVAFDVAATAIAWARRRFPGSPVRYEVADVLGPPAAWTRAFDFVFEAYTLQSLPQAVRPAAIDCLAGFVGPGGTLLVIARGRDERERIEGPPWSLAASELERIEAAGLEAVRFEDYVDDETPPQRRFRAQYGRPRSSAS